MAFAEDLLDQAFLLLNKETKNPKQASLRRAVSTAYYAVFHLLVQETCSNWNATAIRDNLARAFSHQTMYIQSMHGSRERSLPAARAAVGGIKAPKHCASIQRVAGAASLGGL